MSDQQDMNPYAAKVRRWADDNVIGTAIHAVRNEQFSRIMEGYPNGIPDAVWARMLLGGMQAQIRLLTDLITDALSAANDWDEDTTRDQQIMFHQLAEFIREEGKLEALGQPITEEGIDGG